MATQVWFRGTFDSIKIKSNTPTGVNFLRQRPLQNTCYSTLWNIYVQVICLLSVMMTAGGQVSPSCGIRNME